MLRYLCDVVAAHRYLKEAAEACDAMLGMIANEPMLPGSKIEKLGMQKFLEDIKTLEIGTENRLDEIRPYRS